MRWFRSSCLPGGFLCERSSFQNEISARATQVDWRQVYLCVFTWGLSHVKVIIIVIIILFFLAKVCESLGFGIQRLLSMPVK